MNYSSKRGQYDRLLEQLKGLLTKTDNQISRMATIVAVLHHKRKYFFWTGFYCLTNGELLVGPYQGPVACQVLAKNKSIRSKK